jgi:ribokinase
MHSNQRQPSIWVVGSTMVDLVSYARRLPEEGETVVGERFALGFGGKGANQAVMAGRLGARVSIVNCVGDDVFGEMTLENFRGEGIDVTHVSRTPLAASGVAPIWVEPSGANRIIVVPGANGHIRPKDAAQAIAGADTVDVVLGQLEIAQEVTMAAFAGARERGAVTILNPAPAAALDAGLVAVTDWLVPNEIELATLATSAGLAARDETAMMRALAAQVAPRLLVTLGERGAVLVRADGSTVEVPTERVEAVDTTGAGDAFVGAFAFGLATGLAEEVAVGLGCACATASVLRPGTQASFLEREDAARVYESVSAAPPPGFVGAAPTSTRCPR